jgi:ribosomal protein S6
MAKNKDIEAGADDMLVEGSEPRVYELGFHIDPELPSEDVKKAFEAVRSVVATKSEIVAEGAPQKIPLAYTISRQETSGRRDFDSAYFSWIVYEATPEAHAEIVAVAGADKKIVRFIDLLTTKEAARHAVEMRELSLKMPEQEAEEVSPAGADLDVALENATI